MFFERTAFAHLQAWQSRTNRKPLLLQGARQVGKTSLLKHFGKEAFTDVAYFNFETQRSLHTLFAEQTTMHAVLGTLSVLHGRPLQPHTTLIIFDEIQESPSAIQWLKYFAEEAPNYAIAGAGSLLGITLGRERTFPVGKVEFLTIHPLTFFEYLGTVDPALRGYLRQMQSIQPIPNILRERLLSVFRTFLLTGGMPEPARILAETSDISASEKTLRDILMAYRLDFAKHAPTKDNPKITYIWDSLPAQLGRDNKKFLYQSAKPGARAREYEDALLWLVQAGLVHKIYRTAKPHIPLSAYDDLAAFKLYALDVGILRVMAQLDARSMLERNTLFTEFNGSLTENYVLQSLTAQFSVPLRYWTSNAQAEIDFLLQHEGMIIPIEVKSDENIRSKSMSVYHQQFAPPIRIRYSLRNLSFDGGLLNIPLYCADATQSLLDVCMTML